MNRTKKTLAGLVVPAALAVGVAAGVVFAQTPNGDRDDEASGQHQMMDGEGMQSHMKEILGDAGYQRMLEAMGDHADGMPMDMSGMDGMMAAMSACMGTQGDTAARPDAMPGGEHDSHHLDGTS